jgi:GNAT superfamily N-acetyltransferase
VISAEPFDSVEAQALIEALDAEMRGLYAGESDIGPKREAHMFEPPHGAFLVLRAGDGLPVGCGGVCRFDETRAELKRMYVAPEARGRGLGRLLLEELERAASALGYRGVVLETGDQQPEALGLYASAGYEPIPCYGVYAARPLSRCFEKRFPVPGSTSGARPGPGPVTGV